MNAQIIKKDSEPEWAIVPYEEYLQLVEAKEMLEDVLAFDQAIADDEDLVPHAVIKRLVEGENPIRVWRDHCGMTQEELSERAGIRKAYLSQIENGKRTGSAKVLAALAEALGVAIEDLLDVEREAA